MQKACQEEGLDYDISAHGIGSAENHGQEADVILVGPQVRYKMQELEKMYPNKPIALIQPQDYGLLNGKAVIQQVQNILKEKE